MPILTNPTSLSEQGHVLWFSGLSGAGKTTLSKLVHTHLNLLGHKTVLLDGDIIRSGLCKDLGFSETDRNENIRRISEVARLFSINGIWAIIASISPYETHRLLAKDIIGPAFHHIYIKASLDTCQKRDPKGLYERALSGHIPFFTGVSDRFEEPIWADLIVDTNQASIDQSFHAIESYIRITLTASAIIPVTA